MNNIGLIWDIRQQWFYWKRKLHDHSGEWWSTQILAMTLKKVKSELDQSAVRVIYYICFGLRWINESPAERHKSKFRIILKLLNYNI